MNLDWAVDCLHGLGPTASPRRCREKRQSERERRPDMMAHVFEDTAKVRCHSSCVQFEMLLTTLEKYEELESRRELGHTDKHLDTKGRFIN